MTIRASILAAAIAIAGTAHAQPADPRVQLLPYDADRVFNLPVRPGYAAVVELAPSEAVQNVVVGNSAVWQITANSSSDRIIVKPLPDAVTTNMIVVTDARRYLFLLEPFGGGDQGVFVLRFSYPQTASGSSASAALATYKLRGAKSLFPTEMYDDGQSTRVRWSEKTALPAVFSIGERGRETIVNGRMVGQDYVIEGTARKFVFRLGRDQAVASRRLAGGAKK